MKSSDLAKVGRGKGVMMDWSRERETAHDSLLRDDFCPLLPLTSGNRFVSL